MFNTSILESEFADTSIENGMQRVFIAHGYGTVNLARAERAELTQINFKGIFILRNISLIHPNGTLNRIKWILVHTILLDELLHIGDVGTCRIGLGHS